MYTGDGAVEERSTAGATFETVLQVNKAVLKSTESLRCAKLLARPRNGVLGGCSSPSRMQYSPTVKGTQKISYPTLNVLSQPACILPLHLPNFTGESW